MEEQVKKNVIGAYCIRYYKCFKDAWSKLSERI